MPVIGIDLGTTSLCAAVYDDELFHPLAVRTAEYPFIHSNRPYEAIQDPELMVSQIISWCDQLIEQYPDITAIGLTGQMHGMIYLNQDGDAVSPLYTWQDQTGAQPEQMDMTYSQRLENQTGLVIPPGYGLATVYAHQRQGRIPENAAAICTVADYCVMKLCGRPAPLVHITQAASLGAMDLLTSDFKRQDLLNADVPLELLPEVTAEPVFAGTYRNIPVAVAIGDNQASFAGTVESAAGSILVNYGTGSQVSIWSEQPLDQPPLEVRPYLDGHYLLVGAALCGGRAFAALAGFFTEVLQMAEVHQHALYPAMDQLLCASPYPDHPLQVDTRFSGTRDDEHQTGCITGITLDNFTPAHLMWGVLDGMVHELYDMAKPLLSENRRYRLVASGNGIRKNPALRQRLEAIFALPATLPEIEEEAARGSARFALMCLNHRDDH